MTCRKIGRPHLIFKIMERQWIDKLYTKGSMRFYAPGKWIDGELNSGKRGQGDKYEGVFAIDRGGNDRESVFRKRYKKQLIVSRDGDNKYYQLDKTIKSPTYCFYSLADEHFDIPDNIDDAGIYEITANIEGKYFKDFANGMTKEEVEKLPTENQPAMLIIFGYDNVMLFLKKVKMALKDKYGITDTDFLVDQVKYDYTRTDVVSYTSSRSNPPKELFYKGKEFENQCEGRIVINSNRYKFEDFYNDYLEIEIGSMKEFATVYYGYTPEGQHICLEPP